MQINIIQSNPDNKDIQLIKIEFDGRQQFYVEEDKVDWTNNTLDRNFSNCYMIKAMLEKVYDAGQKGEAITFNHIYI